MNKNERLYSTYCHIMCEMKQYGTYSSPTHALQTETLPGYMYFKFHSVHSAL